MAETQDDVRFCDRCNDEQGAGVVDAGDLACSACGQHRAPHVYIPERRVRELEEALRELVDWESTDMYYAPRELEEKVARVLGTGGQDRG